QHQGDAAEGAECAGGAGAEFENRDDIRHHASDVRAGAAEILRDRAGVSGGLMRVASSVEAVAMSGGSVSSSRRCSTQQVSHEGLVAENNIACSGMRAGSSPNSRRTACSI